eukprot:11274042-Karenia_brevis.AAC.1
MVAEQSEGSEGSESKRLYKNKQFWYQTKMFMEKMFQQENRGNGGQTDKNKRGTSEEKYFRRM